ncbi:MAG: PorT family protein [Flavobacterium sp.]|nr:MAG: PorT family protein [Flavobacterium sp.]
MKTYKILSIAFLALAFSTASAQKADNTESKTVRFGIKGGVNFASITGDDFDSPNARTAFHVGGLLEFPLTDMFSLQGEVLYSGQGFESDYEAIDGNGHIEYHLDYINVPILAKIYVTKGLSIEAGPQLGFKVHERIDADPNDEGGATDVSQAEDFDFGLAGGLTFQTDMGVFASGRYTYGLTDVVQDVDAKNSVFQISLGYKF